MNPIAEFFAKIGFKIDDKDLKTFEQGLKDISTQMGVVVTGVSGTIYAFDKFIDRVTAGGVRLRNFEIQTGQSSQELQNFAFMMEAADPTATAEQADAAYRSLNSTLKNLAMTGANANVLKLLGISNLNQSPLGVVQQMRDYFQKNNINPQIYQNLLGQIGLPANLMNVIAMKQADFQKFMQQSGVSTMSEEEVQRNFEAAKSLQALNVAWTNLTNHFFASQGVSDIMQDIIKIFKGMSEAIDDLSKALDSLGVGSGFSDLIKNLIAVSAVSLGFLGTISAIRKLLLLIGIGGEAAGAAGGVATIGEAAGAATILGRGLMAVLGSTFALVFGLVEILEHWGDIMKFYDKHLGFLKEPLVTGRAAPGANQSTKSGLYFGSSDATDDPLTTKIKQQIAKHSGGSVDSDGYITIPLKPGSSDATDDPTHRNDLGKLLGKFSNVSEDTRPGAGGTYQPINDDDYLPGSQHERDIISHLNSQQHNNLTVNVQSSGKDTDFNSVGQLWLGQVNAGTTDILNAYDQHSMNGGF